MFASADGWVGEWMIDESLNGYWKSMWMDVWVGGWLHADNLAWPAVGLTKEVGHLQQMRYRHDKEMMCERGKDNDRSSD